MENRHCTLWARMEDLATLKGKRMQTQKAAARPLLPGLTVRKLEQLQAGRRCAMR